MKILIDIGHPAHVHYFRLIIKELEKKKIKFSVIARDKEVSQHLLYAFNIPYINRGKGRKTLIGKILYLFRAEFIILKTAFRFKPDIFLSFASPYCAHISKILGKPHISLTDTENARLGILSFAPFTTTILTPASFKSNLGKKHIKFNSFMELAYLHKKIFQPDRSVLKKYNLKDPFVIFRFISWDANHDINQKGFNNEDKISLVNLVKKDYSVLITSEGSLPKELIPYQLNISPEDIHSLLNYSAFYIGEGATMASEAAMLGTPAVYVNTMKAGTINAQIQAGLVLQTTDYNKIIDFYKKNRLNKNLKDEYIIKKNNFLKDKINLTDFLIWFIEKYPESENIIKKNPDYQYTFQ